MRRSRVPSCKGQTRDRLTVMSAQALEVRMAHLEGAYEQINHRLGTVEQRLGNLETRMDAGFARVDERFASLEQKIDQRFGQIDQRFGQMDQRFTWLTGLLVVSILLPVVQRFVFH